MRPHFADALLAAVFLAALAGCKGAKSNSTGDDVNLESDGDADADSDSDTDGDADGDTDSDTGCDEAAFPVAGDPPDILILLDRSTSMGWGSPETYWSMVTGALIETTALMDSQIRFGLMVFPIDYDLCSTPEPDSPLVAIEDINATQIENMISGQSPVGAGTPTTEAMSAAGMYLNSIFDGADKYILLATDGAPNCSADMDLQCGSCQSTQMDLISCYNHNDCLDDVLAIEQAQELYEDWGISLYVVGVGGVVDVWDGVMDDIAAAGGTGAYYPATDTTQLQDALSEIAAAALNCTFDVDWDSLDESVSDDPNLVNLYADNNLVSYSAECANSNGWYWLDEDTIALCDLLCDDYKNAEISVITATFGCQSSVE